MYPWSECHGRGSGQMLEGLHKANVEASYGKMTTLCGVGVSSVFPAYDWMRRPGELCRSCKREEARLNGEPGTADVIEPETKDSEDTGDAR